MEGHSIEEVVLAVDSATMESSDSEYCCHQQGARRSHTRCYLAKMSLFVTSVELSGSIKASSCSRCLSIPMVQCESRSAEEAFPLEGCPMAQPPLVQPRFLLGKTPLSPKANHHRVEIRLTNWPVCARSRQDQHSLGIYMPQDLRLLTNMAYHRLEEKLEVLEYRKPIQPQTLKVVAELPSTEGMDSG